MRILLGAIFAMSLSFADDIKCDVEKRSFDHAYMKKLKSILKTEIVNTDIPVMGGKIICSHTNYLGNQNSNDLSRYEQGVFEGVNYRFYYQDGSGKIQGNAVDDLSIDSNGAWETRCKVDPIDDSHFCSMRKKDITISISKNGINVFVGSDHYPNSISVVRIDKNTPIKSLSGGIFTSQDSENIIQEMREGKTITTRYQKWPSEANIDKSFDLYKVDSTISILRNIYSSINVK